MTLDARFWSKIVMGETPDDCWAWTGATTAFGYGVLGVGGRKAGNVRAHRHSWALHFGPVPDGLWVLHRCDNPPCCNPRHLFLGTQTNNMRDAVQKGRHSGPPRHTGQANRSAKLDEDDVRAIRALAAQRVNQDIIAAAFGVTQALVSEIHLRKIWTHVDAT